MIRLVSAGLPVVVRPADVRPIGKKVAVLETLLVLVYVQVIVSVSAVTALTVALTAIEYVELAIGVYVFTEGTVALIFLRLPVEVADKVFATDFHCVAEPVLVRMSPNEPAESVPS